METTLVTMARDSDRSVYALRKVSRSTRRPEEEEKFPLQSCVDNPLPPRRHSMLLSQQLVPGHCYRILSAMPGAPRPSSILLEAIAAVPK
jgi:hypothetical protein